MHCTQNNDIIVIILLILFVLIILFFLWSRKKIEGYTDGQDSCMFTLDKKPGSPGYINTCPHGTVLRNANCSVELNDQAHFIVKNEKTGKILWDSNNPGDIVPLSSQHLFYETGPKPKNGPAPKRAYSPFAYDLDTDCTLYLAGYKQNDPNLQHHIDIWSTKGKFLN